MATVKPLLLGLWHHTTAITAAFMPGGASQGMCCL